MGTDADFGNDRGDGRILRPARSHTVVIAIAQAAAVTAYLEALGHAAESDICTHATWTTHQACLRSWVQFLDREACTDSPSIDTAESYEAHLVKHRHTRATVNTYLKILRSFYRWSTGQGYGPDITQSIKGGADGDEPIPAITSDQVKKVIAESPSDTERDSRNCALVLMLFTAACETISIHRANVSDVDFTKLLFCHQPRGYRAKEVVTPISADAAASLHTYLSKRRSLNPTEPLFTSSTRRNRLSTLSMRLIVRRMLVTSGLGWIDADGKRQTMRIGAGCLRSGRLSELMSAQDEQGPLSVLPPTRMNPHKRCGRLAHRLERKAQLSWQRKKTA